MKQTRDELLKILHNPKDNLMYANEVIRTLVLSSLKLMDEIEKIKSQTGV